MAIRTLIGVSILVLVCALLLTGEGDSGRNHPCNYTSNTMMEPTKNGLTAVVVGATGAVGRRIMARLLSDNRFSKVIAVTRTEFDFAQDSEDNTQMDKLESQIVPDMLALSERQELFQGLDVAFCALGTTRSKAGSAQRFVEIDRDMVAAFATGAKAASVKHFSLCTAAGSRAWTSLPRGLVTSVHPLLYSHTKWEAQEAVVKEKFESASIFQPGLLDRRLPGTTLRTLEKVGLWFGQLSGATPVDTVAGAMINDAVSSLSVDKTNGDNADDDMNPCTNYYSTSNIRELAASNL